MPLWLIIAMSSFGGGLILLHGFRKSKETSENMLEMYHDMLQKSLEAPSKDDEEDEDDEDGEDAGAGDSMTDAVAPAENAEAA